MKPIEKEIFETKTIVPPPDILVRLNHNTMKDKIKSAIRILRLAELQAKEFDEPVEIAYSGGKDSDVILQLAKESGINYRAIYKNTTIDPKGTLAHVRANGVEIRQPKESFFTLIKKHGFPSFRFRFCCHYLKEYKILNTAVWGVRADESPARAKRYTTFQFCMPYNSKDKVNVFAPIFDWTLEDVRDFITDRNITLAPCYYDNDGNIDFTRRLGCLGCQLQYNRGIDDFKANHNFLKAYLRAGQYWCNTHPRDLFSNVYELFLYRVFFKKTEDYRMLFRGNTIFPTAAAKEYLEQYFQCDLTL